MIRIRRRLRRLLTQVLTPGQAARIAARGAKAAADYEQAQRIARLLIGQEEAPASAGPTEPVAQE